MINIIKNLFRRKTAVIPMQDGTVYVGVSPHTGKPLYVMPNDLEGKYSWQDAKTAAAEQTFAGHADWRVPTKEELDMLYLAREAIGGFDGWYWSSTDYSGGSAWFQLFANGHRNAFNKNYPYRVRCVRNG